VAQETTSVQLQLALTSAIGHWLVQAATAAETAAIATDRSYRSIVDSSSINSF
jgi:hypothetical protein